MNENVIGLSLTHSVVELLYYTYVLLCNVNEAMMS